jgi:hypothetical protein
MAARRYRLKLQRPRSLARRLRRRKKDECRSQKQETEAARELHHFWFTLFFFRLSVSSLQAFTAKALGGVVCGSDAEIAAVRSLPPLRFTISD